MNSDAAVTTSGSSPIPNMVRDMNFIGILTIISGALACLTIIGAVIGVPYIISGLRLREAATAFLAYQSSSDSNTLRDGFERQGRYFFIQKVLAIVGIAFVVVYLIIIFGIFVCAGAARYR
ncbi:MAG: DUF5362 domain-containing protein [candidate division KSB1 bacterium]|nr:DUF5362 domain-containing protein [candidate division KSB1 bacterium]MDZ7317821.1 DUF5362 domain-containing protein [candidate division KSB1 bacterium]MDZ7341906.1 DUF5362 domain-containing protein [candidate division KSB1 bacterium]